jgi:hypothetical protein
MHETEIFLCELSSLFGHSNANHGLVSSMNGQVTFASGIQFCDNLHFVGTTGCRYIYIYMYIYIYIYIPAC